MLKVFFEIHIPIKHALVDLKKDDLFPSQTEMDKIEEIIQALGYVECCSRMLCQRDCSLSEADRVLEFLVNKLRTLESEDAQIPMSNMLF